MPLGIGLKNDNANGQPLYPIRISGYAWSEPFGRETLRPTDSALIYAIALGGTGGGSAAMFSGARIRLTTDGTAAGDDVDVRMSEVMLKESQDNTHLMSGQVDIRIIFNIVSSVVGKEFFMGIIAGAAAITALPTSASSAAGVMFDDSADTNFRLIGANGATLDDNDTGIAADTAQRMLRIVWNSNTTAKLELRSGATNNFATIDATANVVLAGTNQQVHLFIQNEGAAAEIMEIRGLSLEYL